MNITLKCNVSLSKKLRSLLGNDGSITLVVQDIVNGKGHGLLTLDSEKCSSQFDTTETAIMITPVALSDESPNSESLSHASIFSSLPPQDEYAPVVSKMASVHPPKKGQESKSIKKTIDIPKSFGELVNPECKQWINSMESLIEAANKAKNKSSNVDISSARNDRERAVMMEMKEKEESIDIPAWIVNDKYGMLSINDLNISLPLNAPFDLSNISAKRVMASKDLSGLLKSGYVRFISPRQKDDLILKTIGGVEKVHGLEVFSDHEEAQASIEGSEYHETSRPTVMIDDNAEEMTASELESPTEEESMVLNLTQDMPTVRTPRTNNTVIHNIPAKDPSKPGVSPIRKMER